MPNKVLVAAIDFGTTYSGWAFSFRHEYEGNPTKISAKQWIGSQLVSQKAPTCVLIKPDGETLECFGYDAESKYADLTEQQQHKEWYYFKRFKMMLHGRINLERNIMLKDECGKQLPAKKVFSLAIGYLKKDLLKISDSRITGEGIKPEEIHWVLTVPAIWNDAAKQFMRECAKDAGIDNDNLTIALEPEAASLFCRHLPVEKTGGANQPSLSQFKAGTKYLVVDAGGGTVDITVHEVLPGGKLKEIQKASGGAWGGTRVDEAYKQFLIKLFSAPVIKRFQDKHMEDYLDIFRDFEVKKRDITPSKEGKITFRLPVSLTELFSDTTGEHIKDVIPQTSFREKLTHSGDKLRIDATVVKDFFTEAVDSILDHVDRLLHDSKLNGCAAILLVGGFADSPMLREQLEREHKKLRIIVPDDAGLAVLKGAVIYGHNPSNIASRVCKFTYGIKTTTIFDPCKHPEKKKINIAGKSRCDDLFDTHVKIGQTVNVGEAQVKQTYCPTSPDQTQLAFEMFASSGINPTFIDEDGCFKLGEFTIDIPDTTGGLNREIDARMIFGGTEIEVETVDKTTGKVSKGRANFLG